MYINAVAIRVDALSNAIEIDGVNCAMWLLADDIV